MNLKVAVFFAALMLGLLSAPVQGQDDREVLSATAEQRDVILMDMRGFLEAVQDIVLALGENDMVTVVEVARASGMGRQRPPGPTPGQAMPMQFREMGRATHEAFDELALAAEFGQQSVLEELGVLMSNCNGCHANFKLVVKP